MVKDFETMRISTFSPEAGAFPPPAQTILLEREALTLLKMKIGDTLSVQTPSGSKQTIEVSGTVHDPSLAPAWQEQTVYGYITPDTLKYLGESGTLQLLKVVVKDQPYDTATIDKTVGDLTTWLKSQGRTIEEIRIPPPGKHPHQSQMPSLMLLLSSPDGVGVARFLPDHDRRIARPTPPSAIGARSTQNQHVSRATWARLPPPRPPPFSPRADLPPWSVIAQLHFTTHYMWVYIVLLLMGMIPLLRR